MYVLYTIQKMQKLTERTQLLHVGMHSYRHRPQTRRGRQREQDIKTEAPKIWKTTSNIGGMMLVAPLKIRIYLRLWSIDRCAQYDTSVYDLGYPFLGSSRYGQASYCIAWCISCSL